MTRQALRPLERRVLHLRDAGVAIDEIGRRFRRSPEHIERVIDLTEIPGRSAERSSDRPGLRPIERRVLHWRREGLGHDEIAARFRRSPGHIRRIEGLALYKRSLELLASQGGA